MSDLPIRDTVAALDKALARIAVAVTGSHSSAEALISALGRGEATAATRAFLAEGAALIRARLLLSHATPVGESHGLRSGSETTPPRDIGVP